MTLQKVINIADEICPNTFSNDMKTMWVNECEGMMQTEVLLTDINKVRSYILSDLSDRSVSFPDDHTILFAEPCGYAPGGEIKVAMLPSPYTGNNWTVGRGAAPILDVSADGLTVTFADGTFAATGEVFKTGRFSYEGQNAELLVPFPHDKIYYEYLCASIELHMHEYSKYQNFMEEFNKRFGEFTRWYALNYAPANAKFNATRDPNANY